MSARTRWLHWAALLGLAALAVIGYAIGRTVWRGQEGTPRTRSVLVAGMLLEYPGDWREAVTVPAIAGLSLEHAVLLQPGEGAVHAGAAGLLAGSLPAGEPAPLPRSFLALLHSPPRTAVVNLLELQAYR